jgi:transcriptional regulator with XRE-family HTH domain
MTVGKIIKQRRKELRMSADELGARLGKDRSTIYRYENGDIEKLPVDILKPIAEALRTTPEYLLGWEKEQKKNDVLSDIIIRMRSDEDFLSVVETLSGLDSEKLNGVKQMLTLIK